MGKPLRRPAVVLALCAIAACARKSPAPAFAYDRTANFAGLKSYAWFDDPAWKIPDGNSIVDGAFIDSTVREAVDKDLGKKGFAKAAGAPNFYVAYYEGAAGTLSQDKWDDSWAAGARWITDEPTLEIGRPVKPDSDPMFVADSGTKYRKQVTLVLEIRDTQKTLIWRGSRTSGIGTNPQDVSRGIDHAVAWLLAKFPPTTTSRPSP